MNQLAKCQIQTLYIDILSIFNTIYRNTINFLLTLTRALSRAYTGEGARRRGDRPRAATTQRALRSAPRRKRRGGGDVFAREAPSAGPLGV